MQQEMYRFETKGGFIVRAVIVDDPDLDLSWDDDGSTAAGLESGEFVAFGTIVTVERDGLKLGEASLWGSVYADASEFFTGHRSADPMNRNCSAMRAVNGGNTVICHYFPDLVLEAISRARETYAELRALPPLRK